MTPRAAPFIVLFFSTVAAGADPAPGAPTYRAAVRVRPEVLATLRPLLFGDNIEWTNHGMGFWDSERRDLDAALVEEARSAGITHLRYPGGTLSDHFDWSAAMGPSRKPQPNPFDKGKSQVPEFGPEELLRLCGRLGIPATITLNAGTGTPELAAAWVKDLLGRKAPVTAFAIGNEIYMSEKGDPTRKTPEEYVEFVRRTLDLLGPLPPEVKVGVIGLHDTGGFKLSKHPEWLEKVLRGVGDRIAFLDVHDGYAPAARIPPPQPGSALYGDDDFARVFLAAPEYVCANIETTKADLARWAPGRTIEIHITEYGPLVYPMAKDRMAEDVAWNRSLAGALYLAGLFHVLAREPAVVSANHLPLCQDYFGALIGIRGTGSARRTWQNAVFHVFKAYAGLAGREVLATTVECPRFSTRAMGIVPELREVPLVDAAAFRERGGPRLAVCLINRDLGREAQVLVDAVPGEWTLEAVTVLAAPSIRAENGPDAPAAVAPAVTRRDERLTAGAFRVAAPKHSLVIAELRKTD